jgi:SAM-dependent methyltransferase
VVTEFSEVTELAGTEISSEQLERMSHRYHWAAQYCSGKDVLEVGCGSGQGLGILHSVARSLTAGDYSSRILGIPRAHYGDRIELREFDAQSLPYAERSFDVIVLFEAIYYVPDARRFVAECRRVLRPGGVVLIATANKDLPDFNPSPLSYRYYGVVELKELFETAGFSVQLFGHLVVSEVSWRQRILSPLKKLAVSLGLMPKTMKGKKLLKRLVFGRLVEMPAELPVSREPFAWPAEIPSGVRDHRHKVIYCCANLTV